MQSSQSLFMGWKNKNVVFTHYINCRLASTLLFSLYSSIELIYSRAATDQKTHGLDRFADQSHGSDHFSDQQKKQKNKTKQINISLVFLFINT